MAKALTSDEVVRTKEELRLDARDSDDAETPRDLQYSWDFGDGGATKDSTDVRPTLSYASAGRYTATLTVTDPSGASDTDTVEVLVRQLVPCQASRVTKSDSWSTRQSARRRGRRLLRHPRPGHHAADLRPAGDPRPVRQVTAGGTGVLLLDGEVIDRLDFGSRSRRTEFGFARIYRNLGPGATPWCSGSVTAPATSTTS